MKSTPKAPSRDTVTTINADGSHYFIQTADVHGLYTTLRRLSGWAILLLFIALPLIRIGGHPAVFLDVDHRQFHLFGVSFVPQDMWMAYFLITGLGFTLFYLTSLFGRVWCGWACPQTLFLDHVVRRVERFIEGDAHARRQLAAAEWGPEKVIKLVLKHGAYLAIALGFAHVFFSYFVSIPGLYAAMHHAPWENATLFLLVFAMGGALYIDFAWFREQFCIILCPYGRIQSALIDDHSIVIGYDEKRGEPRGKVEHAGDCIDCRRCVQVCPTGIDIRQGLQMECIGCSNCVDACDEVMTRLKKPKGLVRYDSLNGLAGKVTNLIRPRTIIYTVLMLIGACVMLAAFSTFRTVGVGIVRLPGAPYFLSEGQVRNQYMLRLINKADHARPLTIRIQSEQKNLTPVGLPETITVPAEGEQMQLLVLTMPEKNFPGGFRFTVEISADNGKSSASKPADFLGPDPLPATP